jgi:hypothetical protein
MALCCVKNGTNYVKNGTLLREKWHQRENWHQEGVNSRISVKNGTYVKNGTRTVTSYVSTQIYSRS